MLTKDSDSYSIDHRRTAALQYARRLALSTHYDGRRSLTHSVIVADLSFMILSIISNISSSHAAYTVLKVSSHITQFAGPTANGN